MKFFFYSLILSLAIANTYGQDVKITSDHFGEVEFTKYRSFAWAHQADRQSDESGYFCNDLIFKADIRSAIRSSFRERDIIFTTLSPDLLINFRCFSKSTVINGIHGTGWEYWSENEVVIFPNFQQKRRVEAGTLIISIVDRGEKRLIWQGYAEGFTNASAEEVESYVRDVIERLVEESNIRAGIYSKR